MSRVRGIDADDCRRGCPGFVEDAVTVGIAIVQPDLRDAVGVRGRQCDGTSVAREPWRASRCVGIDPVRGSSTEGVAARRSAIERGRHVVHRRDGSSVRSAAVLSKATQRPSRESDGATDAPAAAPPAVDSLTRRTSRRALPASDERKNT